MMKTKKILLFDNYDSFTYNLVHAIKSLGYSEVDVKRNNKIELADVNQYDKIILSPGPGVPEEAGIMLDLIKEYAETKSILGVCLGHQAIGQVFGAGLTNIPNVFHGVQTPIKIVGNDYIFNGLPEEIAAGRYHSWIVSKENFPADLVITAVDNSGDIMALKHRTLDLHGVQFHPESILTPDGIKIINNFLE
ncbi:MAG: anthranilate synthase component II [Fermentimonas caenicola]|jgi:anthranilate synthase component 2|uniref:Anthranilate synthase component II n=1 Tax=Fermentimonas caenicola TaxID=1562970 RepID=A0A098C1T2_9BACT|nr:MULTISPECIES: aminodeoxychorismate/anthranilate synthase component II [Lascolabacillus]MDI9625563.1 aminodeoxychorismate/anthranilate synthase component II [Bacteroidota bacterium]CEA16865.1 anthranilate synthase component II [Fermentimonas caenicola]MDD2606456.1 aminodeoxychorismate/anthranilate synthase component II [Lascolabacillus sp.]MDD3657897.1 aminodeoxychorismate/anthranilate synthase component II [Lascolabacillus sp.]MDD4757721.1 aminodeoxychorismate/anthranilate synthase componen